MQRSNRTFFRMMLMAVVAITVAIICRVIRFPGDSYFSFFPGTVRTLIYFSLFMAWLFSLHQRILQSGLRRHLIAIAALLIFWMMVRTCKYFYLPAFSTVNRLCWYAYYVPIQFIPMLSFLVSLHLGHPESYHPPRKAQLLFIPTICFMILIFTNDFHHLAFTFPNGRGWTGVQYGYGIVYWLALIWDVSLLVAAIILTILKCRTFRSKRWVWFPVGCYIIALFYGIGYIFRDPVLFQLFGDITAFLSVLVIFVWESCIQCGMLPSNRYYDQLFSASTVCAQIIDENNMVRYSSKDAVPLSAETLQQMRAVPIKSQNGVQIMQYSLRGGYLLWQEDVSQLTAVMEQLEEQQEALREQTMLLQEEYQAEAYSHHLEEKNRLYDKIQRQTAPQVETLSRLLEQFEAASGEQQKRRLMEKIVVFGSYLKRRSNLIILSSQNKYIPSQELIYSLKESIHNLHLCGVEGSVFINISEEIEAEPMVQIYDFFETVVEHTMDTLESLLIHVFQKNNVLHVSIEAECNTDCWELLEVFKQDDLYICQEDKAWYLTCHFPKEEKEK